MLRFTRELIALRRRHACLTANRFFDGKPVAGRDLPDISWHGIQLDRPPWAVGGPDRFLRYTLAGLERDEEDLHVILNMSGAATEAVLPTIRGRRWHVALDTSRPPPADIRPRGEQTPHVATAYTAPPRSVIVLEARASP
jgi:glycogen operon protein